MNIKSVQFTSAISRTLTPLTPFLHFIVLSLTFLSTSRIALSIWQADRINAVDGWLQVLLQGIRIDISTLSLLLILPMLISVLLPAKGRLTRLWFILVRCYLTLAFALLVMLEVSSVDFIMEYDLRPNRLFIEYLIYPKEVSSMLIKGHLFALVVGLSCVAIAALFCWCWLGKKLSQRTVYQPMLRPVVFIVVLVVVFLGARSTLAHRPINPAMVYFSNDPLVNSLVLNSAYAVGFAAKQMSNEKNAAKVYGELPRETIIEQVKKFKGVAEADYVDTSLPTLAKQTASYQGKPKNLVIVLQESLGARFVGSLNGLPLTPALDKLSEQGWYFSSLFATGTRSVRGIEAVMTGFTPTPARAVVKLDRSQTNFFTLAQLLKNNGYFTQFIYGGESHFDNMKSFFLGNGVTDIHDLPKFEKPDFVGSWGASDGDLFNEADKQFTQLQQKGQPFFSFVFTSSNHDPFEIPQNSIEDIDYPADVAETFNDKELARHRAIHYADKVMGEFFEKAKQSNYWQDTVFLVIADHDARAFGHDLVPIKCFHIPGLILGQGVNAKVDNRIVSQIDMAPTLLSLMGVNNSNPMLGTDLTQVDEHFKGRAMMQYDANFALLTEQTVTILQPNKAPSLFQFNQRDFSLAPLGAPSQQQAEQALAISLWGSLAYDEQLYRLPVLNKPELTQSPETSI